MIMTFIPLLFSTERSQRSRFGEKRIEYLFALFIIRLMMVAEIPSTLRNRDLLNWRDAGARVCAARGLTGAILLDGPYWRTE